MDSTFGKWEIINDTLFLEEIGSYYTYNFDDMNFVEIDKLRWKAIINDSTFTLKMAFGWNPILNKFKDNPILLSEKENVFRKVK